jgi:hypothetical protein
MDLLEVRVVDGHSQGLMSLEDMRRFGSKINLKGMVVQMRGKHKPLEQTTSGHPIADLTEYPRDCETDMAGGSADITVPGAMRIDTQELPAIDNDPQDTQVNELAETGGSDLETDTSDDEHGSDSDLAIIIQVMQLRL